PTPATPPDEEGRLAATSPRKSVSEPLLIQPASGGRISGGYLYNARMAEQGLWRLCELEPERLPELAASLQGRPLLMDSIWLTPEHAAPFLDLAGRGQRVAVMLHSFPSLISAAESGASAPAAPSAFELETLAR